MAKGITAKELIKKVPGLTSGNFWYWVRFKLKVEPCGEKRIDRQMVDVYPDCSALLKKKFSEKSKRGRKQKP